MLGGNVYLVLPGVREDALEALNFIHCFTLCSGKLNETTVQRLSV